MTEKSALIHMYVDKGSIPLLWICIKNFESIPNEPDDKATVAVLLDKLAQEMAADSSSPYDALLTLTLDEGSQLDFALHMTMTDATLAKQFGDPADKYIGKVRLSSLADHVHLMADLLRTLNIATQLADHEHRISIIEEHLGIVSRSNYSAPPANTNS